VLYCVAACLIKMLEAVKASERIVFEYDEKERMTK
jgi:hypothetical protein